MKTKIDTRTDRRLDKLEGKMKHIVHTIGLMAKHTDLVEKKCDIIKTQLVETQELLAEVSDRLEEE